MGDFGGDGGRGLLVIPLVLGTQMAARSALEDAGGTPKLGIVGGHNRYGCTVRTVHSLFTVVDLSGCFEDSDGIGRKSQAKVDE